MTTLSKIDRWPDKPGHDVKRLWSKQPCLLLIGPFYRDTQAPRVWESTPASLTFAQTPPAISITATVIPRMVFISATPCWTHKSCQLESFPPFGKRNKKVALPEERIVESRHAQAEPPGSCWRACRMTRCCRSAPPSSYPRRHPEERRLRRVSKDGRTHCAEHHPSRRAENGAHLRMTASIASRDEARRLGRLIRPKSRFPCRTPPPAWSARRRTRRSVRRCVAGRRRRFRAIATCPECPRSG
jgi:hypothetical protein